MKGLFCPAPAPCPTTSAAAAALLWYTFNCMRIHSFAIALIALTATTASAQRLPTTVAPIHYDITVTPRLSEAKFSGAETIQVRVSAATPTIVLNAAEITFGQVSVSVSGRQQRATVTHDGEPEQVTFTFPSANQDDDAQLTIAYDGILNEDLRGLYLPKPNN